MGQISLSFANIGKLKFKIIVATQITTVIKKLKAEQRGCYWTLSISLMILIIILCSVFSFSVEQQDTGDASFWLIALTASLILQMEDVDGACDERGNRSSSAPEEPPGILQLIDKLEDVDGTCDEGGIISSPAPEEPPGILQLTYLYLYLRRWLLRLQ